MNPSQATPGLNLSGHEYPVYSHSQLFVQFTEEGHGQKRFISPESQMVFQYTVDKRLRHNSLEYVLDLNSQPTQQTFIRKVTLEDVMRCIDNLVLNTVKKEDLKNLATKQDLTALEGSVKAQATELHQLKTAFSRQQGEINSLRETIDSNCAAILNASERSADRGEVSHLMYTVNGGPLSKNTRSQVSKSFNLVIEGIPDCPTDEIYSFVLQLAEALEVILYKRDISNISRIVHRQTIGGRTNPGPVVVTFVHAHLRDMILRNKVNLNGMDKYKSIYVNPDEPMDIRRRKAKFRRIAYLARLNGQTVSY